MRTDLRVPSSREVSLHLHDLGGTGAPLLICHATGFCGRAYEPLVEGLRAHFRLWALDFRGHGLSDPAPDGDYTWDRMAEDVRAVARELSPDGVHALGHSMGGAAALLAEARWPGTVRSAYVFEPALLPRPHLTAVAGPMSDQARRRTAVFRSRAEARERLIAAPAFARWSEESLEAFVDNGLREEADGSVRLRCAPETEAACYSSPVACIADVADVRIPLTVGAGLAPDHLGSAASARLLAQTLTQARLVEHAGLSHFGPFERPDQVAAAAVRALVS